MSKPDAIPAGGGQPETYGQVLGIIPECADTLALLRGHGGARDKLSKVDGWPLTACHSASSAPAEEGLAGVEAGSPPEDSRSSLR